MLRSLLARALPIMITLAVSIGGVAAQNREMKNPVEGQPKAIDRGEFVYKRRCASCHGFDLAGYRAPDLTVTPFSRGDSDSQLYRIITRGVMGTEMPASNMNEDEVWALIAYMRTMMKPTGDPARGNADAGERIYTGKGACGSCHMINGKGGRLGPDLSRIGLARSPAALTREIRRASEYLPQGYEPVTVVTRDGRRIRGCRKNEDSLSIQIMDTNEQLLSFLKKDLREVVDEKQSVMPDYGTDKLNSAEIDDLLAYLRTLRSR